MSSTPPSTTPASDVSISRRPWSTPQLRELPKLTSLTLASFIGGGGGTGGGGSTVFGLLLAAGVLLGLGACSDQGLPGPTAGGGAPGTALQTLECRADLATGSLGCGSGGPSAAAGQAIVGGQGLRVGLRSSNVSYDGTSHLFSADVSVQNLSGIAMGTSDGTTADTGGIKVFFVSGPTGDVGAVTVANATGTGTFTSGGQPYFKYDTLLASQQQSGTQTWQFQLDPATTSFTFSVLVAAVMPNAGAIVRWTEEPGVVAGNWEGIAGWGTDNLVLFGQFGEAYIRENGVWSSRNDPAGSGPTGPVVAAGANDITMFNGSNFTIRHWDGISWRNIESLSNGPGSGGLTSFIGGTSGAGAYAMGFWIRRFAGAAWVVDALPGGVNKAVGSMTLGTDLVILTDQGRVWRQDFGSGVWTQIGGTGGSGQTQGPKYIFGTSNSDLWTISNVNNTDPVIRHWDGTSWTTQATPSGQDNSTGSPIQGVAVAPGDAYIVRQDNVGHGHLWHFDGTNWTDIKTNSYNYSGIWLAGSGDLYLAEDGGRVERDSAGTWSTVLGTFSSGTVAWERNPNDIYVGDITGNILHYDGTQWGTSASFGGGSITSLWGSGPADVWGARGVTEVMHRDTTGWTSVGLSTSWAINGVGGSGPHDVWAVGQFGQVFHYDGNSWANPVAVGDLTFSDAYAVWSANPNFAVAVGQGGLIMKWLGTSWALETSPTGTTLRSVWGSGPSDVWAVGDGGVAVHFDGTSWNTVSSGTAQDLKGVWVASPSEAYAVGNNNTIRMYNGVAWTGVKSQASVTGLSFGGISGTPGGQVVVAGTRILRGFR